MKKQAGMTIPSMLVLAVVGIILVKAGMAIVPMYWDDRMLGTVLNRMQQTPDERQTNPKALLKLIEERLSSNNLKIPTDTAKITTTAGGGLALDWEYERRDNWLGSVDIVVRFKQTKEFNK